MGDSLVSIILCTYNGELFIKEQLDSLLWQTYPNIEIIISDDASSDGTVNILKQYMHDKRIKIVLQQKNLGPVKNFEYAASLSKGKYIAFADQDDIWLPQKLEKLVASIKDSYLVFSDSFLINEYGNKMNIQLSQLRCMFSTNDTRGFIFSNVVWGHAMLIHKNLLPYVLPIPSQIPHDIWMAINATIVTGIRYLNEPLTLYQTLYNLYAQKVNGKFVWPLFFFMLKYRKALFQFTRKKLLSQLIEIRKQSRGEYI